MTGAPSGGQNSPEWETARRIEQFKFSIELFERNYAELESFLQYLEAPLIAIQIAPQSERWRQHIAMREVVFLLHNYVASAQSLIDHARVLYQQLYQPQDIFSDYPQEAAGRFANNPLAQFVRMLRNMAQHYRLPSIRLTTSVQPGPLATSVRAEWTLTVTDLRQWNGWNPPAEAYLASAGERINVRRVIAEYHSEIMAFYRWFQGRQAEIHGPIPQVFSTLLRYGLPENTPRPEDAIHAGLDKLEAVPPAQRTFGGLLEALSPALTTLDEIQLRLYEHDLAAWVGRSLEIITARFGEIPRLRERLTKLIQPPEASPPVRQ